MPYKNTLISGLYRAPFGINKIVFLSIILQKIRILICFAT